MKIARVRKHLKMDNWLPQRFRNAMFLFPDFLLTKDNAIYFLSQLFNLQCSKGHCFELESK